MTKPSNGHPWRKPFHDERLAWIAEGMDDDSRGKWERYKAHAPNGINGLTHLLQRWVHQMQGRYVQMPLDAWSRNLLSVNGYTPAIREIIDMADARTAAVLLWATGRHGSDEEVRSTIVRAVSDVMGVIG
jgi:hypothetical protein